VGDAASRSRGAPRNGWFGPFAKSAAGAGSRECPA